MLIIAESILWLFDLMTRLKMFVGIALQVSEKNIDLSGPSPSF